MLAQWFTEQAEGGLSAALDYARSGLEKVSTLQRSTSYARTLEISRAGLENLPSIWHATDYARAGLEKVVSFHGCGEVDRRSAATRQQRRPIIPTAEAEIQELLHELFRLHDLKSNGVLEEDELIKINEKVALLHYGKEGTDKAAIREKYQTIFREHLDAQGRPVPFEVFRNYMQGVVSALDPSLDAQLMMLEQFVAEAQSGREAFRYPSLQSDSDFAFMPAEEECMQELDEEADDAEQSQSSSSSSSLATPEQLQSPDSSPTRISAGLGLKSSMPDEVASHGQVKPHFLLDFPIAPAFQHVPLPREFSHGAWQLQSDVTSAVSLGREASQGAQRLQNPAMELHSQQTTASRWLQASPNKFVVPPIQKPFFPAARMPVEHLQPQQHTGTLHQQRMLSQPFQPRSVERVLHQPALKRAVSVGVRQPAVSATQPWQQQQQRACHHHVRYASDAWKSSCAGTAFPVAAFPQHRSQARQASFGY